MVSVVATGGVPGTEGATFFDVFMDQYEKARAAKLRETEQAQRQQNVATVLQSPPFQKALEGATPDQISAYARLLADDSSKAAQELFGDLLAQQDLMNLGGGRVYDPNTKQLVYEAPPDPEQPTIASVVVPILHKLAAGGKLTQAEGKALEVYTRTRPDPYGLGSDALGLKPFTEAAVPDEPESTEAAPERGLIERLQGMFGPKQPAQRVEPTVTPPPPAKPGGGTNNDGALPLPMVGRHIDTTKLKKGAVYIGKGGIRGVYIGNGEFQILTPENKAPAK